MKLKDYFIDHQCHWLYQTFGVTTVEECQAIEDTKLLKCRGIGTAFIKKLRSINTLTEQPRVMVTRGRNTKIRITGLNVVQRNALIDAIAAGELNTLINNKLEGVWKTYEIQGIPIVFQQTDKHDTSVSYKQ